MSRAGGWRPIYQGPKRRAILRTGVDDTPRAQGSAKRTGKVKGKHYRIPGHLTKRHGAPKRRQFPGENAESSASEYAVPLPRDMKTVQWKRGDQHRIYATDEHGIAMGWIDVTNGNIEVKPGVDPGIARVLLAARTALQRDSTE